MARIIHTPGPYATDPRKPGKVFAADGNLFADTFTEVRPLSECVANAALVAAADKMVAAVQAVRSSNAWGDLTDEERATVKAALQLTPS